MSADHVPRSPSSDPQLPAYTDDLEWITGYLVARMLSDNSRIYTYILWICIAGVFIIFTIAHFAGFRGGYIGAVWRKRALRRRTWRGKSVLEHARKTGRKFSPVILPPNSQIIFLVALGTVAFILAAAGPDYLSPNLPFFNLSARATEYDPSWFYQFQPTQTINKAWWTSGSRTGLIAFALMPLCVLFALKAPPFALFAIQFTTQLLHRWVGRLIWFLTLLHVILWSVQLLLDRRSTTGKIGYIYAWQYEKFIYGWIAFALLTLLIFSSSRPIRKAHYEIFYASHIVLVPLTLIMSAMHHPPVAFWCYIALGLWCAERMWRATWWLQMNGFFGKEKSGSIVLNHARADSETEALRPWQHSTISSIYPPASPYLDSQFSLYADGNLLAPATAIVYSPPSGFAHAELLSGATVRLTYITPGFLSWAPGQHFLINIPSVARFLSHPFTTASICDEQAGSAAGRAIVFLVRCRTGWTRDLWNHVANMIHEHKQHVEGETLPNSTVLPSTGVLLKMYVDGPFGSAARARWGDHSSVVIFVAGSGVSFGLSILEYVCLCLAGRDGKYLGGRPGGWAAKGFKTRRVKFVWMIREYAHIQWCASILRRCIAMISSPGLDVDIFVTNFKSPMTRGILSESGNPQVSTSKHARSNPRSEESAFYDSDGDDAFVDLSYYTGEFGDEENDIGSIPLSERENYTLDLTNFEGDNDESLPGERQLNRKVRKQGKKLRAKSRRLSRIINLAQDGDQMVVLEAAHEHSQRHTRGYSDQSNPGSSSLAYLDSQGSDDESIDIGMRPVSLYSPTEYPPKLISPSSSRSQSPLPLNTAGEASAATTILPNQPSSVRSSSQPTSSPPRSSNSTLLSISRPAHTPIKPSPSASLLALDTSTASIPGRSKRYSQPQSAITAATDPYTDDGTETYQSHNSPHHARPRLIVEGQEMRDVAAVSVKVRPGKPKLDRILHDEVEQARGSVIVHVRSPSLFFFSCTKVIRMFLGCGPLSFNAVVRKAIAFEINPDRIRRGDRRGHIELVSEEFEF
ncbi:hypothetical protein D9757_007741 [Collybiopsis confluens]|uniref:FAD-binding FR-type domain-containing protein n=1 Tax=Collybiopsis confluens TaxID=2823264 RepID=A0A8H5H5H8_9AGAR|nr:hypothetical protein D9757_007741 [Collybiopsis confluens]